MADKAEENKGSAPPAKPTQSDMVKQSLEKFGRNASPKDVQADVKERFGIDVRTKYISMIKAEVFGKSRAGAKTPTVKAVPIVRPALESPVNPPADARGPAIHLEDILTVQALVGRVGAGPLRTLIDLFEG